VAHSVRDDALRPSICAPGSIRSTGLQMTDSSVTAGMQAEIPRYGRPAPLVRIAGWSMLSLLVAFIAENVLIVSFGFPGFSAAFSEGGGGLAWV